MNSMNTLQITKYLVSVTLFNTFLQISTGRLLKNQK